SGLWWAYRDVVRALRPSVVLVENVASGLRRWHGPVRCSLEAMGYRTWARQISAADVGAPHRRERVFVLAYADGERRMEPQGGDSYERRWPADGSALPDSQRGELWIEPRGRGWTCGAGSSEPRDTGQGLAYAESERRDEGFGREREAGRGPVA